MKVNLTHKEANLLAAIIWELDDERSTVVGASAWRLSDDGRLIVSKVFDKLEEANEKRVRKTGKHRDLSGAPKGSILDAKWSA